MRLVLVVTGALGAAAILEFLPEPWIWIAAILAVLAVVVARRARSAGARLAAIHAAMALATLGGFEGYLSIARAAGRVESYEGDYKTDYFSDDDDLGYVPNAGRAFTSTKRVDGEPVYTVEYTIGADGLRVTPESPAAAGSVLFFGDSYTFGEGLPDEAALPWMVGSELGGRLRAYNFGFHGYGPHHMLAMLQSDRVAKRVAESPVVAIYAAIPDHIARVRGRDWDKHGPRYRLNRDGDLVRDGQFDDGHGPFAAAALERLEKSHIFRRTRGSDRGTDDDDMALYLAVVAAARSEVAAQFPDCRFEVLLWGESGTARRIWNGLRERGITVHREAEFLPGFAESRDRYVLGRLDSHPNATANREIAHFVIERIVAPPFARELPDVGSHGDL